MGRRAKSGNRNLVVGIVRVSTSKQDLGPVDQRREIDAYCAARGMTLLAVFFERISGSTAPERRASLVEAAAYAKANGAGTVLAARRDRIARGRRVAEDVETFVETHGAQLLTADGMSDLSADDPNGLMLRGQSDLTSEWYRAVVRTNTRKALAVKKARGERVGTCPYGYTVGDDGVRLVADAHEQSVIALVRQLSTDGLTQRAIAVELTARGILSRRGKPLAQPQIHHILAAA